MSAFLLDTHVLLWWLDDPNLLPPRARELISDAGNTIYVSAASLWEMAIKKSIGRLDMPTDLIDVLDDEAIEVLDVSATHALAVGDLPRRHDDPFDRMLVAQARADGLVLVTRDEQIRRYDVRCELA